MNITLQLLRMMDSSLTVESVYGEGSTFSFEVEQGVVDKNPMGDFAEEYRNARRQTYQEQFTAPEARILVVDDNSMNLAVIRGLLKQTEVRIDTAEGGEECLRMVKEKKYDIIFLDHRMPVMDGVETLREMKKMADCVNANTPVISLTANAISGARELYIKEGFHDYLTKPIDSSRLERMVIEYLPKEKVMLKSRDASGTPAGGSVSDGASSAEIPAWLREVWEERRRWGELMEGYFAQGRQIRLVVQLLGRERLYGMNRGGTVYRFSYDALGGVASVNFNNAEYYYLKNAQGDIVKIIDSNGATVVEYKYDLPCFLNP